MPRIQNKIVEISKEDTYEFFSGRKKRFSINPLTAVIYQDKNPQLAEERDSFEKEKVQTLVKFSKKDTVLDIGCGIGRWTSVIAPKVGKYLGVDFCEEFIEYATNNYKNLTNVKFEKLDALEINRTSLKKRKFTKIIIAGLLLYLNDEEIRRLFTNLLEVTSLDCTLYLREPLGEKNRLTLKNIWSEELEQKYSAIYRTREELLSLVQEFSKHYPITYEGDLYDSHLNNRKETKQHIFIFSNNE